MKTLTQQPLIKGVFKPEEAREVLQSLFKSKMQFHSTTAFSIWERTGVRATDHLERNKELAASLQELLRQIDQCGEDGLLHINCTIEMEKHHPEG